MGKVRSRLSYANVVASLALFIALGGSSYAAVQLSRNSVRSTHIQNGQVKSADLARGSVTSAKVEDASLLASDFKAGQLPAGPRGETGERGPQGAKGDRGDPGAPGSDGANGATNLQVVTSTCEAPCITATAVCPAGTNMTGGGGFARSNLYLYLSRPSPDDPRAWLAGAKTIPNVENEGGAVTAYAVCASP